MSDQRRLHVAKVVIEFEFAFIAMPEEASTQAARLIAGAAGDLSSLRDYADVTVRRAAPAFALPDGYDGAETVYKSGPALMTWDEAVQNEKRIEAESICLNAMAAQDAAAHAPDDGRDT